MVAVGDGATVRADSHVELLGVILGPSGPQLRPVLGNDSVVGDDGASIFGFAVAGEGVAGARDGWKLGRESRKLVADLAGCRRVAAGAAGPSAAIAVYGNECVSSLSLLLSGWGIAFSHCDCRCQGSQSRYSCNARNNLFAKRHLGKPFLSYVTSCPKAMPSKYRPECVEFPLIRIPKRHDSRPLATFLRG